MGRKEVKGLDNIFKGANIKSAVEQRKFNKQI